MKCQSCGAPILTLVRCEYCNAPTGFLQTVRRKEREPTNSISDRAAMIVAWGQTRKWTRKDIIERMINQIDGLGAAYASTLYQKFAT